MALQIKGKFVENAAIDGDKLELKAGQSVKAKKADGSTVDLVKLDETITEGSKVRVNGEQVALKSQVDGLSTQVATQTQALIAAETAARIADVDAEEARALAAEAALSAAITAEETARIADVNAEETRALAAEAALSSAITSGDAATLASANSYTDTKVAALVDAAPALLDTLNELAAALGDDPNFATSIATSIAAVQAEVDAVETSLAAEVTRATAAESALQTEIDAEELARAAADTALQGEVDAVEAGLAQELLDRAAGDASTLTSANSYTDTEVAAEETRALAAEAALQSEVDAVEVALAAETTAREAADTALDGRVDALEAVAHHKMKFVLSAADITNGYVDLAHEAQANSTVAAVGRLAIHEGASDDYTVSVVGGVTRITFVGNLVAPSEEQLAEGDVIYVKYMA